jgi:hypothetical protein
MVRAAGGDGVGRNGRQGMDGGRLKPKKEGRQWRDDDAMGKNGSQGGRVKPMARRTQQCFFQPC